jgi:hypothetical protein
MTRFTPVNRAHGERSEMERSAANVIASTLAELLHLAVRFWSAMEAKCRYFIVQLKVLTH